MLNVSPHVCKRNLLPSDFLYVGHESFGSCLMSYKCLKCLWHIGRILIQFFLALDSETSAKLYNHHVGNGEISASSKRSSLTRRFLGSVVGNMSAILASVAAGFDIRNAKYSSLHPRSPSSWADDVEDDEKWLPKETGESVFNIFHLLLFLHYTNLMFLQIARLCCNSFIQ